MSTRLDQKKKAVEVKGRIREFVFGIQDGLISTVGLLTGVQSATGNSKAVIISGIAAMFTGALSMATGSYLSTKAEKEIFEREIKEQESFVTSDPHLAQEGLLDALSGEGLTRDKAYRVVKVFAREKAVFLRTFQEKVLGLGSAELAKPFQAAVVMYLSFIIGALVPIAPYFFLSVDQGVIVSVSAACFSLFLVGVLKGYLAKKSLLYGGIEFLAVALGSAGLGWLVGKALELIA